MNKIVIIIVLLIGLFVAIVAKPLGAWALVKQWFVAGSVRKGGKIQYRETHWMVPAGTTAVMPVFSE